MANSPPETTLDKWQKAIGKSLPLVPGNRVDFLIDGWAAFEAIEAAIETTLVENDGSYYIYLLGWYCDIELKLKAKGRNLDDLLSSASKHYNVQVRIVLWDAIFTADVRNQPGLDDRNINSGAVNFVNDLPTGAGILDNNTIYPRVGAHHQKLLVVKGNQGLLGLCGGVDINADRVMADNASGAPLHDVHCRIVGDGALGLLDVFAQRWLAVPQHVNIDKQADDYTQMYRRTQQSWGITPPPFSPSDQKGPLLGLQDLLAGARKKALGKQYTAIARTFNFKSAATSCAKEHSIKSAMLGTPQSGALGMIATAKKFIYIEDQYLWNFDAARAIGLALDHLQYVIILTSHTDQVKNPGNSDGGLWAHYNFITIIDDVAKEKGYDGSKVKTFHRVKTGATELGPNTYTHAKCWIFDDELAVIGSANCNRRGWESDSEVAAIIYDDLDPADKQRFAKTLRANLWHEHLGVPVQKLYDWLGGDKLWPQFKAAPKKECNVVYYDIGRRFGGDKPTQPSQSSWNKIDPGEGNLAACGNISTIVTAS
jgi:phosphatidylserine/phosphatidylglycerophosphate/cardiolipin synthase-like enzyme